MSFKRLTWMFAALLALNFVSCEKDFLNQDVPPEPELDTNWMKGEEVPIIKEFYMKVKVDTVLYVFQDDLSGYSNRADSLRGEPCSQTETHFIQRSGFYNNGINEMEVDFMFCYPDNATSNARKTFLSNVTYPFANPQIGRTTNGVRISWRDKNGDLWASKPGTGATSNYSFRILKEEANAVDTLSESIITGTMDLFLFKGNQSVRLEGAEFRMRLGKFD
jgi:hypothetical protein